MDSGDEDELTIGARDYEKMKRSLIKSGIRDGASKGTENALQSSFDLGYEFAYKHCLRFGKLQSIIENAILAKPELKDVLDLQLAKVKEAHAMFMTTDYPKDKIKLDEFDNIWNLKWLELTQELNDVYPSEI